LPYPENSEEPCWRCYSVGPFAFRPVCALTVPSGCPYSLLFPFSELQDTSPFWLLAAFSLISTSSAGLVAYWPFNDAATLGNDAAGGSVLTANGGAAFNAAGKTGGGLSLNGSGQFLSGTVNNLPVGNSTYTQAAWFKPTALGARGIVGWGNFGASRQVNALRIFDSGNGFRHYWWAADLDATGLATNFLDGNWHHVGDDFRRDDPRRIYLDGTQVAQDTPGSNAGDRGKLPHRQHEQR
jgi:hypothetical protein